MSYSKNKSIVFPQFTCSSLGLSGKGFCKQKPLPFCSLYINFANVKQRNNPEAANKQGQRRNIRTYISPFSNIFRQKDAEAEDLPKANPRLPFSQSEKGTENPRPKTNPRQQDIFEQNTKEEANVRKGRNEKVRTNNPETKQEVVSITYEEIGLFPRSFSRVLDRFLKQVFSDVENLVIQEYRFYRYLFLTTLKCLLILFFVPFFVNFISKTYIVRPLTEYFWNGKQTEIFLNSYQQKRAFAELKDFEEKLYFESLIYPKSAFIKEKKSFASENESTKIVEDSPFNNQTNQQNLPVHSDIVSSPISEADLLPRIGQRPILDNQKTQTEKQGSLPTKVEPLPDILRPSIRSFAQKSLIFEQSSKEEATQQAPPTLTQKSSASKIFDFRQLFEQNSSVKLFDVPNVRNEAVKLTKLIDVKEDEKAKDYEKTESLINAYTLKSSLFVYQTIEADKNIQQRYQEKTIELAQRYNDQSIEAITNFFADFISLLTLFYLLYALEIQINITKSFLLEVFFGLDDSKKSLLILLVTDLLVGYHSSNLWELFFEFLFNHYGLPESQTGIFLLVATLPVLLDVLFKYLIFRHLNRSSPATVATYHAMIE